MPTVNRPERLKLEGVLAYAHEKRGERWEIELVTDDLGGERDGNNADGIIAYINSPEERQRLIRLGKPLVLIEDALAPDPDAADYRNLIAVENAVTLLCDHEAEGRAAADYFLARHFTSFAFIGVCPPKTGVCPPSNGVCPRKTGVCPQWCEARFNGFRSRLGIRAEAEWPMQPKADPKPLGTDPKSEGTGPQKMGTGPNLRLIFSENHEEICSFLRCLTKPTAVFCAHDIMARKVLSAANDLNIAVPQELAILGVDNDEVFCTTVSPALSSIPTRDHELGYDAGRILEELLTGRSQGGRIIRFRNTRIISRRSTDADVLSDPFVARALTYARHHLADKLDLPTIARHVGYSSRMLQIRAERTLGHPIPEEIRHIRLAAALELIRETDEPIALIAAECGFTSTSHMSQRVKEATGLTPLVLRRRLPR